MTIAQDLEAARIGLLAALKTRSRIDEIADQVEALFSTPQVLDDPVRLALARFLDALSAPGCEIILLSLCDRLMAHPVDDPIIAASAVQALVNLHGGKMGAPLTALGVLDRWVVDKLPPAVSSRLWRLHWATAVGMRGRAYKDLFFATLESPTALPDRASTYANEALSAFEATLQVVDQNPGPDEQRDWLWRWPLTNMVSIGRRMQAEGIKHTQSIDDAAFKAWIDQHAQRLDNLLSPKLTMPQAYNFAAKAELVMSNPTKATEASKWLQDYLRVLRMERAVGSLDDSSVAFKLQSTLRQWTRLIKGDAEDLNKVRMAMQAMLLDIGDPTLDLPAGSVKLMAEHADEIGTQYELFREAFHGDGNFYSFHQLRGLIIAAESVGSIRRKEDSKRIGTGFLVPRGFVLPSDDDKLDQKPVLITNAHVICWHDEMYLGSIRPEDAEVVFEGRTSPVTYQLAEDWIAPVDRRVWLDVAILKLIKDKGEDSELTLRTLPVNPVPRLTQGKVWLIGHPEGDELRLSLGQNDVQNPNVSGMPRDHHLHYTTRSSPGSSGSPVLRLDENHTAHVVALHIGSRKTTPVNGGVYLDRIIRAAGPSSG